MNVKALHGTIYFITPIDDYSQCEYVYASPHRYEAPDMFKCFVEELETQLK